MRGSSRTRVRKWSLVLATVVVVVSATAAAVAFSGGHARPALAGVSVDRAVPPLTLENEDGRTTSLAAYRGRVVVLSPFLTLCSEVCPLTTGALQTMQRAVDSAGLGGDVVFVEVSVDPWRDTPRRLQAFARLTDTRFPLLTGSKAQLARFWRFFGVASWRTKEGTPPDIDWLTGKPLTFDVSHTDALFLVDGEGRERIVDVGMPDVGGRLPAALRALLSSQGRADLAHPQSGWTIADGLDDLGRLLGRSIGER